MKITEKDIQKNIIEWEDFAQVDSYWSILTDTSKKFGKWNEEEFFNTGRLDTRLLLSKVKKLSPHLQKNKMLDFGCGVGRITQSMGDYFNECFGLDISSKMISIAQSQNKKTNCVYLVNQRADLALFKNDEFDLIYSRLVLQHVPSKDMVKSYIKEFVRVLKPQGILIFQLPISTHDSIINTVYRLSYPVLRKILSLKFMHQTNFLRMTMTAYPENEVLLLLKSMGGKVLLVEKNKDAGYDCESRTFYISK